MTPADAKEFGVENGQIVKLEVNCPGRSLIFGDVVVRVRDDFALACHVMLLAVLVQFTVN